MTKKLEELLGISPFKDSSDQFVESPTPPAKSNDEIIASAAETMAAMSNADKIDVALASVTGLLEHDNEMDDISNKAISSYYDLIDLGKNVPDVHAGKVYEVAANMLKTAMEAREAKVNKKLKMIDLQLKKLKIDRDINPQDGPVADNEFDRNELLNAFVKGNGSSRPANAGKPKPKDADNHIDNGK